jgi:hypothetical protein
LIFYKIEKLPRPIRQQGCAWSQLAPYSQKK